MIDSGRTERDRETELCKRKLAVLEELRRQLQIDVPFERMRLEAALARARQTSRKGQSPLAD